MGFYSPLSYPKTVTNRSCWCGKVISYELEKKKIRKSKKGTLVTGEMEEKGVAVSCTVTARHCTGEQLSGKPVHSPTAFTACMYSNTAAVLLSGGRVLCGIRSTHNPTTNSFGLPSIHSFSMLCTGSTVGQA